MKLKTKFQDEDFELGEVVEAYIFYGGPESSFKVETRDAKGGYHTFSCDSLKELNDLFEDYEEPKEYYWIDYDGKVKCFEDLYEWQDKMKQIGNYFSSREEAEKAVEKLKAWKRLKDKGFRFTSWSTGWNAAYFSVEKSDSVIADLDLLFSGEDGDV